MYLERKTEEIFGKACLEKKFVFQSEISTHSLILFSKIKKFYRIKELSKSNQTRYGVFHVYLERKTKKVFGIACLEKSSYFNRKYRFIRLLYAYSIFKNIEVLSGQGVIQIEQNLIWTIPCVPRA